MNSFCDTGVEALGCNHTVWMSRFSDSYGKAIVPIFQMHPIVDGENPVGKSKVLTDLIRCEAYSGAITIHVRYTLQDQWIYITGVAVGHARHLTAIAFR